MTTVYCIVRAIDESGQEYAARFNNCYRGHTETNVHAEEFAMTWLRKECPFERLRDITIYITLQPCHHSAGHQSMQSHRKSCTEKLVEFMNAHEHIRLRVKCAGIYRAHYTEPEFFDSPESSRAFADRVQQARDGILILQAHERITVSGFDDNDWEFIRSYVPEHCTRGLNEELWRQRFCADNRVTAFLAGLRNRHQPSSEPVAAVSSSHLRVQVLSDIHLESRAHFDADAIEQRGDVLVLAGDIGYPRDSSYMRLLDNVSARFPHVIIVFGNHEYWCTDNDNIVTTSELQAHVRATIAERGLTNVHFLENDSCVIDGVRFLGCTLWSNIPRERSRLVRRSSGDYKFIYSSRVEPNKHPMRLSVSNTNVFHAESVEWLRAQLHDERYGEMPTVVVSHHCPYPEGTSPPQYEHNPFKCCYVTDLSGLISSAADAGQLRAWLFGHTHHPYDRLVAHDRVRLVSNPLGMASEFSDDYQQMALRAAPVIEIAR